MIGRRAAVLAVVVIGLVTASNTVASPAPIFVTGQFLGGGGNDTCNPLGGDIYQCFWDGHYQLGGDLQGVVNGTAVTIVNCGMGSRKGHGAETFTGTVASVGTGTLTWKVAIDRPFDCAGGGNEQLFTHEAKVTSGTGALSGLRGKIDFVGGNYSGVLF